MSEQEEKLVPEQAALAPKSLLGKALKIAVLVFALALGGISLGAWLAAEPDDLPFDYEGFD